MQIENLCLEVTRKCNMECAHCLRGDAQKVNMTKEIAYSALSQFDYISSLTFTGGEPLLNVPVIEHAIYTILYRGIDIGGFYLVTNGLKFSPKLMDLLTRLYNIADEKEMCGLAISRDQYHDEYSTNAVEKNWWRYEEYPFFRPHDKDHYYDFSSRRRKESGFKDAHLIPQGRAVDISTRADYKPCCDPIKRRGDYYSGLLYVNALGCLTYDCDLSYESQEKFKVGTVDRLSDYLCSIHDEMEDTDEDCYYDAA